MRVLSDSLLQHIKNEIEQISFGSVIIKLSGDSNKVDVITESRQRFEIEDITSQKSSAQRE